VHWELNAVPSPPPEPGVDQLFQDRLLDNMYDAVVFVDGTGTIRLWNRGAERLTGVIAASVCGQAWHPALLDLSDEKGNAIQDNDCPVYTVIRCGAQSLRRLRVRGRGQRPVAVDTHAIPVIDAKGVIHGAVLLFHDASSEISLERQCQSLHEKATKDPLTQVANRAEFDRVHAMFVVAHQQQQVPCSLVMCDMDHFKLVNDTYGHQAGDDAIKSLASLLKSSCRPGDLVARYGGEEFVLLCTDCDNSTAVGRAEQVRKALGELPQARMDGDSVTASFGVTEIQPGDTPETMLRRADRALLMAKDQGRDTVVQLGTGSGDEKGASADPSPSHRSFRRTRPKGEVIEQDLVTPVPVKMAIEKLRGFVADHRARILSLDADQLQLEIDEKPLSRFRRLTDRPATFCMDLRFAEERLQIGSGRTPVPSGSTTRTRIHVAIGPRTKRDRRHDQLQEKARNILASFRSYLMAEEAPVAGKSPLKTVKRMLAPWLMRS
jgi:diguanylate cyclase (GGDEF)-like protein